MNIVEEVSKREPQLSRSLRPRKKKIKKRSDRPIQPCIPVAHNY